MKLFDLKKFTAAVLLIVLLSAGLSPQAAAAQYCNLGSVYAGTELHMNIPSAVSLPAGTGVSAVNLPAGCEVTVESGEGFAMLYLTGTPMSAGKYSFDLEISSGDIINCSINILPGIPVYSGPYTTAAQLGGSASVSVSASAPDYGSVSCKWFVNSVASNSGGTPAGEGPECAVDTSKTGTLYYYCEITNTNNGFTTSVVTAAVPVTVERPGVSSLRITTPPKKLVYAVGDSFDPSGIVITVVYSNGASEEINTGFSVSPGLFTRAGAQTVELGFGGRTCYQQVTVNSGDETITGIGVVTLPDRTEYEAGDSLETAGLIIRVWSGTDYYDLASGFTCSPMQLNAAGKQTITVTYKEKTCTFTVDVKQKVSPRGLKISALPVRTQYTVGEDLDCTGMVVVYTDDGGSANVLNSGYICTPSRLTRAGTQEIIVSYNGTTDRFTVYVSEAAVTPAPTAAPAETPAPTAVPAPAATPGSHVIEHQAHETPGGRGLLVTVIVLAAVCLATLSVYVFIMNNGGPGETSRKLRELMKRLGNRK